eukprot:Phypoly_transcript_15521.p1 GENE.Phypoly_transcript_15521~~Phypoly_transcript_15521.p1  ORF type:complete len:106 (+),score=13.46 Phypoly_transcript_15521:527-844(+)
MIGKLVLGRPLSIHFSNDQARGSQSKHTTTTTSLQPDPTIPECEPRKLVELSNEAMEAKIFAIKTKLQLMEKEKGAGDIASSRDARLSKHNNKNRYDPYFKHKYS